MNTRSRKNKGRRLQNRIAEQLATFYNLEYGKDKDFQGREMGQSGTDIRMSKEALSSCPFDIETKNQESWNIPSWWKQCKGNCKPDRIPLLIVSKNRHEDLAILTVEDLFKLLGGDKNDN